MTPKPTPPANTLRERRILQLLVAQAFTLSFGITLLYTTANTLFLVAFGAAFLPYLYCANAALIALVSFGFAQLQMRWSLRGIVLVVLALFSGLSALGRWGLTLPNALHWLPLGLMMAQALQVQLSNILVGIQAGQLFDVRQMKRLYPRVLTAQVLGVVLGGSAASFLQQHIGGVPNLLVLASAVLALSFGLAILIAARFPAVYLKVPRAPQQRARAAQSPLRRVLGQRYPRRLFFYQISAAVVVELVITLLLTQLRAAFSDSATLAQFLGGLVAVGTLCTLLFLTFFSGRLLNRFGLALGLTGHPTSLFLVLSALALVGGSAGPESSAFFWLVMTTRVVSYILYSGLTLAAIKTAYQALDPNDQAAAQAVVEGVGTPLAYVIVATSLLGVRLIPGNTLLPLALWILIGVAVWLCAAVFLYRDYAVTLRRALSRRALSEAEFDVLDSATLRVVETLLNSGEVEGARLALEVLSRAEHPSLEARLRALLTHPDPRLRAEALRHIEWRKIDLTTLLAQRLAFETDASVLGRLVRALCALQEAEVVETVRPYAAHPEREVQLGALVGLLRYGGIMGALIGGEALLALQKSALPADQAFAARVIGEAEQPGLYPLLLNLLAAPEVETRRAALLACGTIRHPRLWPALIAGVENSATRSTALAALSASGDAVLPLAQKLLKGALPASSETLVRLARLCGQLKHPAVISTLRPHWQHPDPDVRLEVLTALYYTGYQLPPAGQGELRAAVQTEIAHGLRISRLLSGVAAPPEMALLHSALAFELTQTRRRVCVLLTFAFEPRAIWHAADDLEKGAPAQKALAFETLDVTLTGDYKKWALPLLDPTLSAAQRADQLSAWFAPAPTDHLAALREVIARADQWPRPWTRACAIEAAARLRARSLLPAIQKALVSSNDPVLQETGQWAVEALGN